MILQTGSFIKAEEVRNGDIITIKDAGTVSMSEQFKTKLKDGTEVPKKQYVFKIECGGVDKNISMNKVSRDNLAAAYTNNTEKWIGRKASIEKCLFPNGKRGIVLSPIVELDEHQVAEHTEDESTPF